MHFLHGANQCEDAHSRNSKAGKKRRAIRKNASIDYAVHVVSVTCGHASDSIEGRKRIIADRDAWGTRRAMQQPRHRLVADKDTCDLLPGKCKQFIYARSHCKSPGI